MEELKFVCKMCGERKDYNSFSPQKACKYGIDTGRCKQCKSEYERKRRIENYQHEKYIYYRLKSRCRINKIPFNLDLEDIVIPDVCPVFGTKFIVGDYNLTASVDRITPSLGYVKGNIRIISNKANRIRNNVTSDDLITVANWLKKFSKE